VTNDALAVGVKELLDRGASPKIRLETVAVQEVSGEEVLLVSFRYEDVPETQCQFSWSISDDPPHHRNDLDGYALEPATYFWEHASARHNDARSAPSNAVFTV